MTISGITARVLPVQGEPYSLDDALRDLNATVAAIVVKVNPGVSTAIAELVCELQNGNGAFITVLDAKIDGNLSKGMVFAPGGVEPVAGELYGVVAAVRNAVDYAVLITVGKLRRIGTAKENADAKNVRFVSTITTFLCAGMEVLASLVALGSLSGKLAPTMDHIGTGVSGRAKVPTP